MARIIIAKADVYRAIGLSLWLVVFLVIIAPYDVEHLPIIDRIFKMPIYGVLFLSTYVFLIAIEDWIRRNLKSHRTIIEVLFYIFFAGLFLFLSFSYYKSNIVNGGSRFISFTVTIFLPIFLLILPFIFLLRKKRVKMVKDYGIRVLKGENKEDLLSVEIENLVAVKSSGNYVEVYYLKGGALKKKLLRNTLRKTLEQEPYLMQVHRCYLINPIHIIDYEKNILILTKMKVKTSKKYDPSLRSSLKNKFRP